MDTQENIDQRIWDYLDGHLSGKELEEVNEKIRTNDTWRNAFESASIIHGELRSLRLEQPPVNFTEKVMQQIAQPVKSKKERSFVVLAITLFFGTCILFLLFKAASEGQLSSGAGVVASSQMVIAEQYNQVKDYAGYLFMAMNVVLALVLLDKVVLRRRMILE